MDLVVVALCCAFRLLSVFAVSTFFSPDEYWQSLEVAHNLAFGLDNAMFTDLKKINKILSSIFKAMVTCHGNGRKE